MVNRGQAFVALAAGSSKLRRRAYFEENLLDIEIVPLDELLPMEPPTADAAAPLAEASSEFPDKFPPELELVLTLQAVNVMPATKSKEK